ncbi:TldD protein [Parelusimicrobium proximum]|uniref:TldD/PmbA family protein n=1 Tax=Parelusimicrobium proximum TaxID=3228953 RepID=UPI003D16B941
MKKIALIFAVLCSFTTVFAQSSLTKTLNKELMRNFKVLKKQNPPVYFLSYFVEDSYGYELSASLGEKTGQRENTERILNVEARAGSAKLDNTHEIKGVYAWGGGQNASYMIALDENAEPSIKNALWRATDEAAKRAQERFLQVKANSQVRTEQEDKSDDFSRLLSPVKSYEPVAKAEFNKSAIEEKLLKYSALMREHDFILDSSVSFSVSHSNRYIVTSEGTQVEKGLNLLRLSYVLYTKTEDGMDLERVKSYDGFNISEMPSDEKVEADIKADIEILRKLKESKVVEPFSGPAILMNKASGVFFHEILGHRVEGHRQKSDSFGQTFTKKVGEEIVSPVISVYDDPTLAYYNGIALRGYYLYDDEGMKASNTTIIEDGVLKGFLMSRNPIQGFRESNGHGRKAAGFGVVSRMGNTIVKAKDTKSFADLKEQLKAEAKKQGKEYGIVIEEISGGFTMTDRDFLQAFKVNPMLVYKVYVDGREDEIVRGVDVVGTPLASFNKIIAAADDYAVFNGMCGAESGWVPVSAIAPSLLISEIEIEKVSKSTSKPPLLAPPHTKYVKEGN